MGDVAYVGGVRASIQRPRLVRASERELELVDGLFLGFRLDRAGSESPDLRNGFGGGHSFRYEVCRDHCSRPAQTRRTVDSDRLVLCGGGFDAEDEL